jgi:hypothetical protein
MGGKKSEIREQGEFRRQRGVVPSGPVHLTKACRPNKSQRLGTICVGRRLHREPNSLHTNTKGVTMYVQKATGCAAAAAIAAFMSIGSPQAAMSLTTHFVTPNVHHVDCAVGLHIGPLGTCVVGIDNPPPPPDRPVVVEHRGADDGCQTKSVNRTDSEGNSETKTMTNCPQ